MSLCFVKARAIRIGKFKGVALLVRQFFMGHWIKHRNLKALLVGFLLGGMLIPLHANPPLPADEVFQPSIKKLDAKTLAVQWTIKPGYYLYREKIHFQSNQN